MVILHIIQMQKLDNNYLIMKLHFLRVMLQSLMQKHGGKKLLLMHSVLV